MNGFDSAVDAVKLTASIVLVLTDIDAETLDVLLPRARAIAALSLSAFLPKTRVTSPRTKGRFILDVTRGELHDTYRSCSSGQAS